MTTTVETFERKGRWYWRFREDGSLRARHGAPGTKKAEKDGIQAGFATEVDAKADFVAVSRLMGQHAGLVDPTPAPKLKTPDLTEPLGPNLAG
ncbi:hypothetical protein [Candidatus Poriferisocius sp.]|uniref:hypothetical protein n=1 Tax=Candidatus Poriferisocius sp. TaxID=3101276 RepID=UPI003B016B96